MSTGIGETLQDAREQQGRTPEDVARSLRLRTDQVRALEEERFDSFGGDVYARGFLKSYALELGLEPAPLLDAYRQQVGGDDVLYNPIATPGAAGGMQTRRGAPPGWIAWVLTAVVVLAGLAFIGQVLGGRTPPAASPDPTSPPPAPATDDDPADGDDPSQPEPEEEPEPDPTFDGVELLLALEQESWMRVTVDGSVVFEQVAGQGETLPFSGDQEVTIRFGNPGGVRVELNGQDLGTPGVPGQPVTVSYTPDGESEA